MTPVVNGTYSKSATFAPNPTLDVTLTPAWVTDDVLILVVAHGTLSTTMPTSVSGLGATWVEIPGADASVLSIWKGTGATASTGTITATGGSDVNGAALGLYHISGASSTAVGVTTTGAGTVTSPSLLAARGQVVIAATFTDNAAGTIASTTPGADWVTQPVMNTVAARHVGMTHRIPTSDGPQEHNVSVTRTTGSGYVSAVVLGTPEIRTNLCTNPSFEAGVTGWTNYDDTLLTQDTTVGGRSGAYAMKVLRGAARLTVTHGTALTGAPNAFSQPVTAGQSVTVSMYVRQGIGLLSVFPMIFWQGTTTFSSSVSGTAVAVNDTWQRISLTAVAPAGAVQFGFGARVTTTAFGNYIYVDDAMSEVSATLGDYFDGSTVNAGFDYAWTGTAHASSSTETVSTGRTNLLPNPSFETGKVGWTSAGGAVSTIAAYKVSGDSYLSGASSTTITDKLPATAGRPYVASGYFTRGSAARTAAIVLRFYDAANAELSAPTVTPTSLVAQDVPERRSHIRTAPAGTTQMAIQFAGSSTFASSDAFLLEQSGTVRDYFDGSTVKEGFTYAWTGTPHASSSTESVAGGGPVTVNSAFSGSGILTTAVAYSQRISSTFTGSGTLESLLTNYRRISSGFAGSGVLSTAVAVPRTNLFTHPSAEGVGIAWSTALGTNTTATSAAQAWVGAESYAMTADAATAQEIRTPSGTSAFPVTAGQPYALSFYTRAGTTAVTVTPKLIWYTAAGTLITEGSQAGSPNSTAGWTRHSAVLTAPANAAFAAPQIRFTTMTTGEVQYIDGLLLEQSSTVKDYFDGATVNAGFTYSWTGAPNASASKEAVGVFTGFDSRFSGSGTLSTALTNYKRIAVAFSGSGTLSTVLALANRINSQFSGSGTLSTALTGFRRINSAFSGDGTLTTSISGGTPPTPPAPAVSSSALGRLASFSVNTAAVPANPAEGSGSTPSVNASYTKGTDPEYALGETNVLKNGAIGTYEGEIVSLGLSASSAAARISMDTLLTPLNVDMHLFPFIDGVPGLWTAARALDYWTQQAGVFYDKLPGDVIAYASGFGHTDSFGASTTDRFYERLTGGATTTQVVNGRSVKTLGSAVTGTTALHEVENGSVTVSLPMTRKLVFSAGLGLLGTGRTATVRWNFLDSKDAAHTVSLEATSAGSVTAKIGTATIASASVPAGATYRLALSLERLSATTLTVKLTVHTDDLAGAGTLAHDGAASTATYALPGVMRLTALEHVSAGGSGAQMTRWGTYLTVAESHPMELPAVQKVLGETKKPFGFVSGFEGNVWNLLNEFCSIAKLDVRFLDGALHVAKRTTAISSPGISWSQFEVTAQRREKYKQVAVVNKQSKAVSTDDAVLWRADSVFSVAAREVFETTVQTPHSILNVRNPVAVSGILPFPYVQGAGQYVVTGADGYIISPAWWNDHGGKVEVSLTGKEGEIAIKITAPVIDTVRAPYRISEGEADRPALYVCGSGILNDPKEVHVASGAKNAREGFDSVFESPFIAGVRETYDTAAAMAHEYSASVAEVQYALPNDFETPTGLGQYPAGTLVTDNKRNFRIMDASQTHSKVSGNAVPHTTIGAYVASYPEGATLADEQARHAGRTIRKFNIKPLKGDS